MQIYVIEWSSELCGMHGTLIIKEREIEKEGKMRKKIDTEYSGQTNDHLTGHHSRILFLTVKSGSGLNY